jgi:hypothetical protein
MLEFNSEIYDFKASETYLIPAIIPEVKLKAENGKFLLVHI